MNSSVIKRVSGYAAVCVLTAAVTLLAVRARAAGVPDAAALTYTGYLENPDGTPATGTKGIGIALYAVATGGGKPVCEQKPQDIEPVSGRFQLTLPYDCTDAVKANPDLWAEVQVEGALLGRTKLGAVPYAIEAAHATNADAAGDALKAGALDKRLAAIEASVTAWEKITPAPTLKDGTGPLTPQGMAGHYRRVGDSAEITIKTTFTTATVAASGYFVWTLPPPLKMDGTKLEAGYTTVGWAEVSFAGDYSTCAVNGGAGYTFAIDCAGPSGSLKNVPAGSVVTAHLTVPIEGWTP